MSQKNLESNDETVLVYGATGAQGASLLRAFVAAGFATRGLARDDREAALVRSAGARATLANLDDPASLRRASEGATSAAIVLPLEYDVEVAVRHGRDAIDAAVQAGVRHVVFDTSMRWPTERTEVAAFEIKRAVADHLVAQPVATSIVRPTFYLENLLGPWTLPGIVEHDTFAYPLPANLRAAWVSHDDVARAVVEIARRPELAGRAYEIGGERAVTGPELAAALSDHLRRTIRYVPIDPSDFERALAAAVGADAAHEIAALYAWCAREATTSLFDARPSALEARATPLADWVAAQRWEIAR